MKTIFTTSKAKKLTLILQVLVRIPSTRVFCKSFEVSRRSRDDKGPELSRSPDPCPANLRVKVEVKDEENEG